MEKKYRIVETDKRKPTAFDQYYTSLGLLDFNDKDGEFWDDTDSFELYPNYWLEEIDENEDRDMIKITHIEILLNELHNDLAKSIIDMKVYSPLSKQLLEIKQKLNDLK
jgi:hypothetical protein